MAKEGLGTISFSLLLVVVSTVGAVISDYSFFILFAGLCWIIFLLTLYFFRDPERQLPSGQNIIVSPADGKIVSIESVRESEFINEGTHKISIFMSPLDVHINRIPISGRVTYFRYVHGKFLAAYKPEASTRNEQTIIGIENQRIRIMFKQIAGVLARRIICRISENQSVEIGQRFGLIKFGSRVEIFLPFQVELKIKEGQKAIGGETILGVIQNA